MKRDDEFLRELLLEIEASNDHLVFVHRTMDGGDLQNKQWFHAQLLCDDGYLSQESDAAYRLTAQGCDLIDSIRDEGIWNKTKGAVAETGGSATLDIILGLARGFLKKKIADHTGIDL